MLHYKLYYIYSLRHVYLGQKVSSARSRNPPAAAVRRQLLLNVSMGNVEGGVHSFTVSVHRRLSFVRVTYLVLFDRQRETLINDISYSHYKKILQ